MAQYMPADFPGLRLFHEHNAEYMIWLREARAARNPLMRSLLKLEYERVRRYEAGILQRFDLIFAVSGPDRDALIEQGAAPEKVQVLPNLPDPDLLDSPELGFKQSEALALFLGTLSWKPNIDSATRLLIKIFPAVQSRNPAARLLLAGTGAPKALMALAERTPGVEFLPDVHDTDGLYRRARVFVEATETGGGTKLKVLNALARGLPVVASPEGASGLEVTPGENILIGRDDSELAGSVERLMTDEALWRRLSECGRQLVREKYVAENAFSPLKALSGVPNHG
jgi:glycosyltransferase involved in cell wall biosynthesis